MGKSTCVEEKTGTRRDRIRWSTLDVSVIMEIQTYGHLLLLTRVCIYPFLQGKFDILLLMYKIFVVKQ